jgi:hypothetical protein
MKIYVYNLRWYCDIYDAGEMITSAGVVAAENMGEAVKRLTTEIFENVEWITIYETENSESGYASFTDINLLTKEHSLIDEN